MAADEVLAVLATLRRAGVAVHVGGGWGVDALLGRQTRAHRDLDLMFAAEHEAEALAALAAAGYRESLDQRPVRFVVTGPAGREVDLHPLVFAPDGSALQASFDPERPFAYPAACFVAGTIGGEAVPCLSPEQQAYFHQGYEPTDRDHHDMAALRDAFGIATHF